MKGLIQLSQHPTPRRLVEGVASSHESKFCTFTPPGESSSLSGLLFRPPLGGNTKPFAVNQSDKVEEREVVYICWTIWSVCKY